MSAYPTPPATGTEAIDILRRLEPAIGVISARLDKVDGELRRQGELIAELRGKVSQLPTLWQVLAAVLSVNAGIMALGFALATMLANFFRHGG
jgi:nicotinate-nucleotide pyrophosphorylase